MQVLGPRQVLSSRVVNSAGEITEAKPEKRRLLWLDVRASVSPRLVGDVRRGITRRRRRRRSAPLDFFADVTLARPGGRFWRGNNKCESADMATSLNYFAGFGSRCPRMTNDAGYIAGATLPKHRSVRLFRAANSPPGGQFRRANNRGGPANTAALLGVSRRLTCDGARFERFELVGVFHGRATKSPRESTELARPKWRPVQFICRCRYFFRVRGHFCREHNVGNNSKVALRVDILPGAGTSLACGQLRRENGNGKTGKEATSLT